MTIQSDFWGNLTIHIHADQVFALFVLVVLTSVVVTLALSYPKGFIQWFKDYL